MRAGISCSHPCPTAPAQPPRAAPSCPASPQAGATGPCSTSCSRRERPRGRSGSPARTANRSRSRYGSSPVDRGISPWRIRPATGDATIPPLGETSASRAASNEFHAVFRRGQSDEMEYHGSMEDPGSAHLRPVSRPFRAFMALFLTAALTHSVLARSNNRLEVGVDNFGQINANYYRGAQPDAEGFRALKRLGIKTVIDLQKDGKKQEADWVQSAGMQYVNIPLSSTKPATEAQTQY